MGSDDAPSTHSKKSTAKTKSMRTKRPTVDTQKTYEGIMREIPDGSSEASEDEVDQIPQDDWYLCEGLLQVFMKKGNKMVLKYEKGKIEKSDKQDRSRPTSGYAEVHLLDLGSCKQTIEYDSTEGRSLGKSN